MCFGSSLLKTAAFEMKQLTLLLLAWGVPNPEPLSTSPIRKSETLERNVKRSDQNTSSNGFKKDSKCALPTQFYGTC